MVVGLDELVTGNEFMVFEKVFILDAGWVITERILTRCLWELGDAVLFFVAIVCMLSGRHHGRKRSSIEVTC